MDWRQFVEFRDRAEAKRADSGSATLWLRTPVLRMTVGRGW